MDGEVTISLEGYRQMLKDLARVDSLVEVFEQKTAKYNRNLEDIGRLSNFFMTLARVTDKKRVDEAIELFNESSENLEAYIDETNGKLRYSTKESQH